MAFECDAEHVSTDPDDVAGALQRLLGAYEPGASYEPVQMGDFYGARLRRLATMRLRIVRRHIKFKTGPAGTATTKRRVAERLRESGRPGDERRLTSSRPPDGPASGMKTGRILGPARLQRGRKNGRSSSRKRMQPYGGEKAVAPSWYATRVAAQAGNLRVDRFSVLLVAVAATLWASDAYFRNQLISHLQPTQIVVAEDALVTLFLLPVLVRTRRDLRHLGPRGWVAVGIIAAGAQALATILFTASFSYRIFAETFVLQQTQPLIAIGLAWIVLGERRRPWFWPTAAVALVAVYMVVFAQDPLDPISALQKGRLEAGLLALGAAALWASGTVLGRFALGSISFEHDVAPASPWPCPSWS